MKKIKLILYVGIHLFQFTNCFAQTRLASFPGGIPALQSYLQNNLRYPSDALSKQIQGKVFVQFVIDSSGQVINVKAEDDLGGGCAEEAVRIINAMPKWDPAYLNGVPIESMVYRQPIIFQFKKLDDRKASFGNEPDDINNYLSKHVNYPSEAKKNLISGNVRLRFIVTSQGKIKNLAIDKELGYGCDEEALRVVSEMPDWHGGVDQGLPSDQLMYLDVSFPPQ